MKTLPNDKGFVTAIVGITLTLLFGVGMMYVLLTPPPPPSLECPHHECAQECERMCGRACGQFIYKWMHRFNKVCLDHYGAPYFGDLEEAWCMEVEGMQLGED